MYKYGVWDLLHLLKKNCTKLIRFCLLLDYSKFIYTCHTVKKGWVSGFSDGLQIEKAWMSESRVIC